MILPLLAVKEEFVAFADPAAPGKFAWGMVGRDGTLDVIGDFIDSLEGIIENMNDEEDIEWLRMIHNETPQDRAARLARIRNFVIR